MFGYWKIIGTHPEDEAQEEDILGYILAGSAEEALNKFLSDLTEELAGELGEEDIDLDDPDLDIPRAQHTEYECSEEEWARRLREADAERAIGRAWSDARREEYMRRNVGSEGYGFAGGD